MMGDRLNPQHSRDGSAERTAMLKRRLLIATRWSAWITVLVVIFAQITEQEMADSSELMYFGIGAVLYILSWFMENKWKW